MKKVSFSDWQEMALKKDVEDIKKKLNSQDPILFSLCWELIVALGSIIVDHLFDTTRAHAWVWIVVIILGVIPPTIILIYKVIQWIHSVCLVKKGNLKIRSYVDTFDNHLSYWVMLSNSYTNMLTAANADPYSTNAEKEFLYREGCYYNNKSMQALYSMKSNFHKIFSNDIDKVKRGNLIDLARLHNLLIVMNEQQVQLDQAIKGVTSQGVDLQKDLNSKYLSELNDFLDDLNCKFSTMTFCWNPSLIIPVPQQKSSSSVSSNNASTQ